MSSFDTEMSFAKLLVRQDDVDLEIAALELARDASPSLDFSATLKWFDQRAAELAAPIARASDEQDLL